MDFIIAFIFIILVARAIVTLLPARFRKKLVSILLVLLIATVWGIATLPARLLNRLLKWLRHLREPTEVREAVQEYKTAEAKLEEARQRYVRSKAESAQAEELEDRLDVLMEAGRIVCGTFDKLFVLMESKCNSPAWAEHFDRIYNLSFYSIRQLKQRVNALRQEFITPEEGDYLIVDPGQWERCNGGGKLREDERPAVRNPIAPEEYMCWHKLDRLAFVRRWQRLFPDKPVRLVLAGERWDHYSGAGTESRTETTQTEEFSSPFYTVEKLIDATESAVLYRPRGGKIFSQAYHQNNGSMVLTGRQHGANRQVRPSDRRNYL